MRNFSALLSVTSRFDVGFGFRLILALVTGAMGLMGIAGTVKRTPQIDSWPLSEFLISYEGGFVRRGLLGFLIPPSDSFSIYLTTVQIIVVVAVLVGLVWLILIERNVSVSLALFTLVVFSPAGLFELATEGSWNYFGRKEFWFYLALLLILLISRFPRLSPWWWSAIVAGITSLSILVHELFFLFFVLPLLATVWTASGTFFTLKNRGPFLVVASASGLTFLFVLLNPGNTQISRSISMSLSGTPFEENVGAIEALSWSLEESHNLSVFLVREGDIAYWAFFLVWLLLVAVAILALIRQGGDSLIRYLPSSILIVAALFTAMYVGWDWGRWISIATYSFVLNVSLIRHSRTSLVVPPSRMRSITDSNWRMNWNSLMLAFVALGFSFLLSLLTQMSPCCTQGVSDLYRFGIPDILRSLLHSY